MNRALTGFWVFAAGVIMVASLAGCGKPPGGGEPAPASEEALLPEVPLPLTPVAAPRPAQTATPPAIPTTASVSPPTTVEIRAKGNLFIRRGPDLAFNPISVLPKGRTAFPTGRDVLAHWVRVPLPAEASKSGWVSVMSRFTEVTGDLSSLPEIEPVQWPQLASLRNCTYHQMLLDPGGIIIPSIVSFPENDVRVNPGSYAVLDVDVDGYPEVLSAQISEGITVDIVVDGNGEKRKCPAP